MDAVTDLDRRQAERVAQLKRARVEPAAVEAQGATDKAAAEVAKSATQVADLLDKAPQPAFRKGDRWAAYNAFVDDIAPRLTLAERAVWHVMFRHARNGRVETTVRMLANAAAVSRSTAEAALRRLVASGLVWAIWKSPDKSKASKYGIHGNPAACLPRLTGQDEPSRSSGRIKR